MKLRLLFLTALIHGFGQCSSLALTTGKQANFNSANGVAYETNLVINPSAYADGLFVTVSNATATQDTDAGDQIASKASWLVDASAQNGYAEWALSTPSSEQTSGNCGFSGIFKGDASLYKAQILDGSATVLAQTTVMTNETGWREFRLWHPCGASGARKVRITQTEAGTGAAINVGKLFYGRMEPGAGVPTNEFAAKVSSTGVVTDETGGDWINGNCAVTSTSTYTCIYNAGFFPSNEPTCNVTPDWSSGGTTTEDGITTGANASQLQYALFVSGGAATAGAAQVTCTKTGSDYIQPAITAPNFNYSAMTYSPTIANGPTCSTSSYTQSRGGSRMTIVGSCTVTAAGAAGNYTVSLPSGFTATETAMGDFRWFDNGTATYSGLTVINSGSSTISFSANNTTQQGNAFANTDNFQFNITVAVAENGVPWTETLNAPQLVGSVTTDLSSTADKIVRGNDVVCGASSTIGGGTGDFTIGNYSSGACVITFTKPYSSANYSCDFTLMGSGTTTLNGFKVHTKTASGFTVLSLAQTGGTTAVTGTGYTFEFKCQGPR